MKIWTLKVIQKIQHFMWNIMHGILPTCINLVGRFVDVPSFCKHYGDELEITEHALRDYPWVRNFWENVSLIQPPVMSESMEMWVARVLNQVNEEVTVVFATFLWCIWFWKNQFHHIGINRSLISSQTLHVGNNCSALFLFESW